MTIRAPCAVQDESTMIELLPNSKAPAPPSLSEKTAGAKSTEWKAQQEDHYCRT